MISILIKMVFVSTVCLLVLIAINKYFEFNEHKNYKYLKRKQEEFKKLWKLSSILPLEEANNGIGWSENFHETNNQLRDWYLNGGALLLSKNSKEMFEIIQDELNEQSKLLSLGKLKRIDFYYIKSLFRILNKDINNEMIFRSRRLFK